MPNKSIYLDYAATTPVDPLVAEAMCACLTEDGVFGNAASNTHSFGFAAKELVENAREQVAQFLGADRREITFTSGATEAINLAIQGYAFANANRGKHIITTQTEHKAVIDTCRFLESKGFSISYVKPNPDGLIDLAALKAAIRNDTILISVLWANNETGVIQPLEEWVKVAKQHQVALHVDAVQAVGRLPMDVHALGMDMLSVSAHKVYGPKGVGALYVRRGKPKVTVQPLIHGGGHEGGLRSGTLPTHQIVGMGRAFALLSKRFQQDAMQLRVLKEHFVQQLQEIPSISVNGTMQQSVPHIVNVFFKGVDGEALIMAMQELAVSAGSACTSATIEPSHVLSAMGMSASDAHSSIRFSFGRYTTRADIHHAVKVIATHVERLRQLSPLWK